MNNSIYPRYDQPKKPPHRQSLPHVVVFRHNRSRNNNSTGPFTLKKNDTTNKTTNKMSVHIRKIKLLVINPFIIH